ncbi:hypothetical protein C481_11120 [Natrialba asiatica DSM 12278]|uniref:Uncharacterized protein n=1 Tax=Natrialba asiatica (strain ATCC 700177 / DSM 12278 / JCM 9576 / FERM P-10747 / NBRC 102637 / 172P1) TaxID=29540 RepID=M0APX8_NATA1|nr:hypothetical protein C481_11120 [Natrialba asiatica DSM 12278]
MSREIFYSAVELPNTQVEFDVDAEVTIIGIAREDADIYHTLIDQLLADVYQYEMKLAQEGKQTAVIDN